MPWGKAQDPEGGDALRWLLAARQLPLLVDQAGSLESLVPSFFSLSSENPNLTGKPRIKSLGQYLLTTRPQGFQASNVGFVFTPLWHKSLYGGRER